MMVGVSRGGGGQTPEDEVKSRLMTTTTSDDVPGQQERSSSHRDAPSWLVERIYGYTGVERKRVWSKHSTKSTPAIGVGSSYIYLRVLDLNNYVSTTALRNEWMVLMR